MRGELRAVCVRPEAEALAEFRQTFHDKGKARIALAATIEDEGVACVRYRRTFVALR